MLPPDMKVFCLFRSGKPISKSVQDGLMSTAVRMVRHNRRKLFMRSRGSSGLVETDLETVEWCGLPGMKFKAELLVGAIGYTSISFFIRTEDIDDFDINDMSSISGTIMPAHALPFSLPKSLSPNTPVFVCKIDDDDDEEDSEFGPSEMN